MAANPLHTNPSNSLTIACLRTGPVFYFKNDKPLEFQSGLPKRWNGKVLSGSQMYHYTGDLGTVIIQEYRHDKWVIRYTVFEFAGKTVLHWKEENFFRIQFALLGTLQYKSGASTIRLKPGMANTLWGPGRDTQATFTKGQRYEVFHSLYDADLVGQLLPNFPDRPGPSEKAMMPIEKEWLNDIYRVLESPYDAETSRFFYENRVRDFLLYLLLRPGSGIYYENVSKEEVGKVHEVDALILQDLTKWLHIPVLAKRVNMTEFKLKTAFKQVIGKNLFERLRIARLEKARRLLVETNMQIKAIHLEIGYKSLSGFEEAFKEMYGMAPRKYRQQFQPPA